MMKLKKYVLLISLLLVFFHSLSFAAILGDTNGNGKLDLADAIIILQTLVGLREPGTTSPTAPTNLTVLASTGYVVAIGWAASTDDVGVTGYNIYRNGVKIGISGMTNYSDYSVEYNKTYSYTVAAYDIDGNVSVASAPLSVTTPASLNQNLTVTVGGSVRPPEGGTPPTVPTGLTASQVTRTSIILTWSPSNDAVGILGYEIYRDGNKIGSADLPNFTDTSVFGATTYSYTVKAINNAALFSAASAPLSVTTPDDTPPTAPTNLSAPSPAGYAVALTWTASTDAKGVTGYEIWRNGVKIGNSTATSYTDYGVEYNKTYSYTVKAYDSDGNTSVASAPLSVTTPATPTQNLNVTIGGAVRP